MNPTPLQSQANECGLLCLAHVAHHHGRGVDLMRWRHEAELPPEGLSLQALMDWARRARLQPRALRVELDDLAAVPMPCVLHWNLCHYVVLLGVSRRGLDLWDPAQGHRRVAMAAANTAFTGVVLELLPMPGPSLPAPKPPVPWAWLLGAWPRWQRSMALWLGAAVVLESMLLVGPWLQQLTVDHALARGDAQLLWAVGLGGAAVLALQVGLEWCRDRWLRGVIQSGTLAGQTRFKQVVLNLPWTRRLRHRAGDLVSRFGSLEGVHDGLTRGVVMAVVDGLFALAALAVMAMYQPWLCALVLLGTVAYAGLRWGLQPWLARATEEWLGLQAQERSVFLENLRHTLLLEVHGALGARLQHWQSKKVDLLNREHHTQSVGALARASRQLLLGWEALGLWTLGAYLVWQAPERGEVFTVGMLVAFVAYRGQFVARITACIDALSELRTWRLHVQRVTELLPPAAPPEIEPPAGLPVNAGTGPPEWELINVGHRHPGRSHWLFRHLNLRVAQGECVAITGPSGGGKSTLVALVLGLLEPTEGEVRWRGQPLKGSQRERLRREVAAVLQSDALLAGSVADNLTLGVDVPDPSRLQAALEGAALWGEVQAWPAGWHTPVGEDGAWLSGGQRQRLCLARALYRQPLGLVLDEATSHLDEATEAQVNAAVARLGMARLVVAHRPSAWARADRVMELVDGCLQPRPSSPLVV